MMRLGGETLHLCDGESCINAEDFTAGAITATLEPIRVKQASHMHYALIHNKCLQKAGTSQDAVCAVNSYGLRNHY